MNTNFEHSLRPIAIRVGQLKSNLRQGMIKFYNKNGYEAIDFMKQ